jgi:hypothetical protein
MVIALKAGGGAGDEFAGVVMKKSRYIKDLYFA